MGIATLVTRGYGAFGSIGEIVTRGYTPGIVIIPPTPDPTPTTNYSGKIDLDLGLVPGNIRDPATDRAILFLHDAVEQLSQDVSTLLSEMDDVKIVNPLVEDHVLHYDVALKKWKNKLVNQVHKFYGKDAGGVNQHEDIDITNALVTGSVLTYVKTSDGGGDKFEALNTFVARGYGGIEQTGTPSMSNLGAGFQVVPANAGLIVTPVGVTQDHINNGIKFEKAGIWSVNITISLSHNEDVAGRTFEVQLYNDTDAVELEAIPVPIARNQPGTIIALTFMVEVPKSAETDLIKVRIGNGSTVTSVVLEAYQFSINRVSEFVG